MDQFRVYNIGPRKLPFICAIPLVSFAATSTTDGEKEIVRALDACYLGVREAYLQATGKSATHLQCEVVWVFFDWREDGPAFLFQNPITGETHMVVHGMEVDERIPDHYGNCPKRLPTTFHPRQTNLPD